VYAAAARFRRGYYSRHPELRRRLARPVISIGNLAVGGRAKTPLAGLVAARLRDMGERPAILSRGYGRRDATDGVVVVRDPDGIRADLDRAGDEPLMLARQQDGIAVLASSSRYLSGRLAEHHFGCTVHVLDDGFQHFDLRRDADIVVIGREDIERPVTLPSGRLREPLDAMSACDAVVALDDADAGGIAAGRPTWRARRRQGPARLAEPMGALADRGGEAVVAVAGIAQPSAFFKDLRATGWPVARELPFPDHHRYSRRDVTAMFETTRSAGAALIVTTEKDLVRLLPFRPFPVMVAFVPLALDIEPAATFDDWLRTRLQDARAR
jgi:tetraacyldisaccharide 4'-kinase